MFTVCLAPVNRWPEFIRWVSIGHGRKPFRLIYSHNILYIGYWEWGNLLLYFLAYTCQASGFDSKIEQIIMRNVKVRRKQKAMKQHTNTNGWTTARLSRTLTKCIELLRLRAYQTAVSIRWYSAQITAPFGSKHSSRSLSPKKSSRRKWVFLFKYVSNSYRDDSGFQGAAYRHFMIYCAFTWVWCFSISWSFGAIPVQNYIRILMKVISR